MDSRVPRLAGILLDILRPLILLANLGFIRDRGDDKIIVCVNQIMSCILEYLCFLFEGLDIPRVRLELDQCLMQDLWCKFMSKEFDFLFRINKSKLFTSRLYQIQLGKFLGELKEFYTFSWVKGLQDYSKQSFTWKRIREDPVERLQYVDAIRKIEKFLLKHKEGRKGFPVGIKYLRQLEKTFQEKLTGSESRHHGGYNINEKAVCCPHCRNYISQADPRRNFRHQSGYFREDYETTDIETIPVWKSHFREKVKKKLKKIREDQEERDSKASQWNKGIWGFFSWLFSQNDNLDSSDESDNQFPNLNIYMKERGLRVKPTGQTSKARFSTRMSFSRSQKFNKMHLVGQCTSDDTSCDTDNFKRNKSCLFARQDDGYTSCSPNYSS